MIPLAGPLFFAALRRVIKRAGGAAAIPGWGLLPERWRKPAQEALGKKLDKLGK